MTEPRARLSLKPGELVGLAAVVATFIGLVTLMVTRETVLSAIVFGVAFVVNLLVLAMLMLAVTPNKLTDGERALGSPHD
jgi:hypothetical protein